MNKKNIWGIADKIKAFVNLRGPLTCEGVMDVITRLGGVCTACDQALPGDARISADESQSSTFEIQYKGELDQETLLYVLCHELGHFFLHMLQPGGTVRSTEYNVGCHTSEQEYEADEFAYSFLMPTTEFTEYSLQRLENKIDNDTYQRCIKDIADHFNVSPQLVLLRGNDLKLWKLKN